MGFEHVLVCLVPSLFDYLPENTTVIHLHSILMESFRPVPSLVQ